MIYGRDEKEGGGSFLYNDGRCISSGRFDRNNTGADIHVAMRDETLHYAAWESREAINAA
jgi:hypothetical protein